MTKNKGTKTQKLAGDDEDVDGEQKKASNNGKKTFRFRGTEVALSARKDGDGFRMLPGVARVRGVWSCKDERRSMMVVEWAALGVMRKSLVVHRFVGLRGVELAAEVGGKG